VFAVKPEGAVHMHAICEYAESNVLETNIVAIDNGRSHLLVRQGATRQLGTLSFDGTFLYHVSGHRAASRNTGTNISQRCTLRIDTDILLTGIGFTPGGSSTVHIYTQIIHNDTEYPERNIHNNKDT
jgi:hypothetical protein